MPRRKQRAMPAVGTSRSRTFKGTTYTVTVVKTDRGVGFKVGQTVYATPTAAAKAITGREINGWVFWGLDE